MTENLIHIHYWLLLYQNILNPEEHVYLDESLQINLGITFNLACSSDSKQTLRCVTMLDSIILWPE